MQAGTGSGSSARLDQVLALVREKEAPEARGPVEAFVRAYHRQVDAADLAECAAADLYGAALSHWNFARRREPGVPKVRVFNPSVAEHGWQSTHSVIEVVNDDMPFLVDSVTMETSIIQFFWRFFQKQSLIGMKSPAAWRTIPFLLMVWHVH